MRRLLRFWNEYPRKYRYWYVLGILCLVATNLLTVAIPTFIQYAIDGIGEPGQDISPTGWASIVILAGLGIMIVRTLSREDRSFKAPNASTTKLT